MVCGSFPSINGRADLGRPHSSLSGRIVCSASLCAKVRKKKLSSPSVVWAEMNNDRTPEPEVKVRNSDSVKARQFRAEDEWPSGTSKGGCSVR